MNVDRTDAEFVQKISKTFLKGGDEKGVNYVYPVDWINPIGETQKGNIMINAEIFMGTLFIETREANEGTWLYFKDPLKQEQTLLYQGDTFEIDSVQYLFDQDKKPNILTIVKFSDLITAKIVRAGNKKYLTSKLDRKRYLVVHLKNKTKYIDNFLLFETNHRNLFYTTEKLTATEQNFSTKEISETELRYIKFDQLLVWDFRGMFENLKQIELLNCHIEKLHRAMILTTSINGKSHQIFLSQQNALVTNAERAGGILYVHRCAKVIVHVIENQFCTEEVPVRVFSDNTSEVIRYLDPNSMEGLFNDKDLELIKRAQRLRHSRKTITGREVFLGQGGLYGQETLEYFNTDLKYNNQWHELLIFEYLGNEVKQFWHVAREITISLMTIFIGSKIIFCLVRVFLSIDMQRSGTNPVIAL